MLVADYLPAGFEIDNPRLVSSGETGTLSWIENAKEPAYSEFRDERFSAAFERGRRTRRCSRVAYVVRAVSPGRYVLPQAYVEDMYRPDRFGRTGTGTIEIAAEVSAMKIRPHHPRRSSRARGDRRGGRRSRGGCAALGPVPRPRRCRTITQVLDRNGRLLRAYATADGRWRLPATVDEVDPRFVEMLQPTRTGVSASIGASIRWRCCARPCSSSAMAASFPAARP